MSPSAPAQHRAGLAPARPGLARLLRDLGPALERGSRHISPAQPESDALTTGIPAFDALLGNGLAPGSLAELSGPPSSGRTSLAWALLARATRAGELVGLVDPGDAFHPASADALGVQLERVLWARPPGPREALRCCERLLRARGFALVVLDATHTQRESAHLWQQQPTATWQRLTRAASASGSALLVLSQQRIAGRFADFALTLQPTSTRFGGARPLFEGLEIEAVASRQRRGPPARPARVLLSVSSTRGT
ncbi:MAG: hypothetical protein AAF430_03305 [Myxococcota bacterium]